MQGVPPSVRLPDHHAIAGGLIEWRHKPDGSWEALVEIVEIAPGYRGGLQAPRRTWFMAHEVEPIPGEDYSKVPSTQAQPDQP